MPAYAANPLLALLQSPESADYCLSTPIHTVVHVLQAVLRLGSHKPCVPTDSVLCIQTVMAGQVTGQITDTQAHMHLCHSMLQGHHLFWGCNICA